MILGHNSSNCKEEHYFPKVNRFPNKIVVKSPSGAFCVMPVFAAINALRNDQKKGSKAKKRHISKGH